MKRNFLMLMAMVLFVSGVGLAGCGKPALNEATQETSAPADHNSGSNAKDSNSATANNTSDAAPMAGMAGLAKLSAVDRASAEKQHMCPVSGEMLGSMGTPIKLTVKDKEVWICCDSCKKKLVDDPDTYLAKLKN